MIRPLEVGHRSETVRRANLSAIVREVHAAGGVSRSELGARTGLTRSAIRRLIGELVAAGLAHETPAEPSGAPGRPSPVVRSDPRSAVVLAMVVEVDSLAAAAVGLGGTILAQERVERARGHLTVEDVVEGLVSLASRQLVAAEPIDRLLGAAVAVVGTVRRGDGLVAMAPNLGWRDVPLGRLLERELEMPVAIANDADLGALGEHRRGAATGRRDVIFLSGEVGLGGGLILRGAPFTGAAGFAGEVGHLPLNPDGAVCRCGGRGCWETEVGEGRLLVRAGEPEDAGRAGVERVIARAAAGEGVALAALEELGRWLGIGIAGLVNVFDPELIVLGARFERVFPWVSGPIASELSRRTVGGPRDVPRIVPTRLGADAALIGAAELALEPILADPARWFHRTPRRQALASA